MVRCGCPVMRLHQSTHDTTIRLPIIEAVNVPVRTESTAATREAVPGDDTAFLLQAEPAQAAPGVLSRGADTEHLQGGRARAPEPALGFPPDQGPGAGNGHDTVRTARTQDSRSHPRAVPCTTWRRRWSKASTTCPTRSPSVAETSTPARSTSRPASRRSSTCCRASSRGSRQPVRASRSACTTSRAAKGWRGCAPTASTSQWERCSTPPPTSSTARCSPIRPC